MIWMNDNDYTKMADEAFAALGTAEMAYIKIVREGETEMFEVHDADGAVMGVLENPDRAVAAVLQHDMVPLRVH
jgi:hypothetical protein